MSYIDTTFERGGEVIKTLVKVYGGWDSSKKSGWQFYDQEFVDWKTDVTLRVAVWMSRSCVLDLDPGALQRTYDRTSEFPLDLASRFDDGRITASIAKGRVSISVPLWGKLPWIVTSNRKPAIDWGPLSIARYGDTSYDLRHMIVFNVPTPKRGDYKEWDLLPFLPGALVERNRRKH